VPEGASPGAYGSYQYTSSGSPLTLIAPEESGEYEVRYQSDRLAGVFFSVPILVD
jgi:Ca-activated chloride channel family protein